MSALIIHNKKLHDSLQSIFDLTWLVAAQTWILPKQAQKKSSLPKKKKKL
jgi:hypothetical protein